jgi:hypothetical protein
LVIGTLGETDQASPIEQFARVQLESRHKVYC